MKLSGKNFNIEINSEIFKSNNQTIDFTDKFPNGGERVIITGRNCSGKTHLLSQIKTQINNLGEDKFVGFLSYNLAFAFDKNRMGNINEVIDNGSIFEIYNGFVSNDQQESNKWELYKDRFYEEFYKQKNNKSFKPFNFFMFSSLVHDKMSDKSLDSPEQIIKKYYKKYLENFKIFENIETIEFEIKENNKLKVSLKKIPTSGEVVFLNLLVLIWIHNHWKKFDFLIFDEPDRHFEPKVTEIFFKILNEEFKNVVIFLTTHRPDSIILNQSNETKFTLCRLKKDDDNNRTLEKINGEQNEARNWYFVMSTIFDLTYNLRDITNIKIKVYVESNDDYTFYKKLYHHLLDHCNELRIENKRFFFDNYPVLSRKYQFYFCTSAQDDNGGDGGISQVKANIKRDSTQQNLDIKNFKSLWDGDFFNSYGIFDRDGTQFDNNLIKYSDNCHKVFKRYTIENYIFDPMCLISLLHTNNIVNQDLKTKLNQIKNIIDRNNNQIQNIIDEIFKLIFNILKLDHKLAKEYFKIKLEQIKDSIRDIKNYNSENKDIESILENLKTDETKLQEFLESNNKERMKKDLEEIIRKDKREVQYFNTEKTFTIKINYPSFFLDINGKIFVQLKFPKHNLGVNSLKDCIDKIDMKSHWISEDFVEIFSDISNDVRESPIYALIREEARRGNNNILLSKNDAINAGFDEKTIKNYLTKLEKLNKLKELKLVRDSDGNITIKKLKEKLLKNKNKTI